VEIVEPLISYDARYGSRIHPKPPALPIDCDPIAKQPALHPDLGGGTGRRIRELCRNIREVAKDANCWDTPC